MNGFPRPLTGYVIGLSISESDESMERGFPLEQVNRVTLFVVGAMFGQGASLIFGHDWRDDGVMQAIHGFAQQMQSPLPLTPAEAVAAGQPLLRNLLPWPDKPRLPAQDLERLSSTLGVEQAGLPGELKSVENDALGAGPGSRIYRYLRARGLTYLRHRLNGVSSARVCLGGRTADYAGRYPGVIEEALLALRSRKPLYLAGFLGGATQQVANAIAEKKMPEDFCPLTEADDLYDKPPMKESDASTWNDRKIDRDAVWSEMRQVGRKQFAAMNGLTVEENEELFHTHVLDRVVELILTGVSQLRPKG